MGQRGQLDRLPLAHTGIVTTVDWSITSIPGQGTPVASLSGLDNVGFGWIVSGGLDRTVKVTYFSVWKTLLTNNPWQVWDLSTSTSSGHIPQRPTYTLHPPFPVRRVLWRPSHECEVAVVSNGEFGTGSSSDLQHTAISENLQNRVHTRERTSGATTPHRSHTGVGDPVEIWDVRRGWIAKWSVNASAAEGGATGPIPCYVLSLC
jgi:WD repeat-containing protein 24